MRNKLFLVVVGMLVSVAALCQSEKWSEINKIAAKNDALLQTGDVCRDIERTTSCPIEDLTGVLDHFFPWAIVGVSSTRTNEIKQLSPEAYFVRLNKLKCGENPKYGIVNIRFDPLVPSEVTMRVEGDTTFVTVPVVQWFEGKSADEQKSYADKTIKAFV